MFTPAQLTTISDALLLAEASAKRGINTNKNPRFKELYEHQLSLIKGTLSTVHDQLNADLNKQTPKK